jgi:hypothetical protein
MDSRANFRFVIRQDTNLLKEGVPTRSADQVQEVIVAQASITAEDRTLIDYFGLGASIRWNEIARNLVAQDKVSPPMAARIYALLSVAQYDALVWVNRIQATNRVPFPIDVDSRIRLFGSRPADHTGFPDPQIAVAYVSSLVLQALFPDQRGMLHQFFVQHRRVRQLSGLCFREDGYIGERIGKLVADRVLAWAAEDNSDALAPPLPTGPSYWRPDETAGQSPGPPVLPAWGSVKPWLLSGKDDVDPLPPHGEGTPEFGVDLAEVRFISDHRTAKQMNIARFWAAGPGTPTPPGMWNAIAIDLAKRYRLHEFQTAQVLGLLNRALMDASIACWSVKYRHLARRPSQVDPEITLPIGLPNFPSYTSGHSTFSAAASSVLGFFFGRESDSLLAMAEEASLSRVYGGIHFRHDCEQGMIQGAKIGELAIRHAVAEKFAIY